VRRKWRDNRERKKKEDGPLLQGLGVDEAGVAEVVEAALREDLGASLEPGERCWWPPAPRGRFSKGRRA
jgi:hypothetical protein